MTIAGNVTVSVGIFSVFVNSNNTLYASGIADSQIQAWPEGSTYPTRNISTDSRFSYAIFVTTDEDIYADRGRGDGLVGKWTRTGSSSVINMNINGYCDGLFVDHYNYLYCSTFNNHQVLKRSLNTRLIASFVVAGNGTRGSASNQLFFPFGIFVDTNLDLYVADCGNNRVQLFQADQSHAITVAGNGSLGTITLACPFGVALDADGYLFIVDRSNNRVVGSGPNGFRCIVGCADNHGSAADQLNFPRTLSFDSHGNLFVADNFNNRIQEFLITPGSCGESQTLLLQLIDHLSLRRVFCTDRDPRSRWLVPFVSVAVSTQSRFLHQFDDSTLLPSLTCHSNTMDLRQSHNIDHIVCDDCRCEYCSILQ